jgi:hypothetical protein
MCYDEKDWKTICLYLTKEKFTFETNKVKKFTNLVYSLIDIKEPKTKRKTLLEQKRECIIIKRVDLLRIALMRNKRKLLKVPNVSFELLDLVLSTYPIFKELITMYDDFRKCFVLKDVNLIDTFISEYSERSEKEIHTFVKGVSRDIIPIKNGIIYGVSNGPIEGGNNLFKRIKRQLGARATEETLLLRQFCVMAISRVSANKKKKFLNFPKNQSINLLLPNQPLLT